MESASRGAAGVLPAVLTIEETAALFGSSLKVVRNAIREGSIESIKLGRTTFVLRGPLEARLKIALSEEPKDA
jgi:hypothetical protein